MTRSVFFSFHYKPDAIRASQVRNMGSIEGNRPARDNDWETVISQSNASIEAWIASQMHGRSCTVVLVGAGTANRKWINHEIVKSWDRGMGVVGIRIHGLKDFSGSTSTMGANPFDHVLHGPTKKKLSQFVKCYNPSGQTSQEKYDWIKRNISAAIEEAIKVRGANS